MRGWSTYFRHAVSKHTFSTLAHFVWHRVARCLMTRHHWKGTDLRRRFTGPGGRWMSLSAGGKACSTSKRSRSPDTATEGTSRPVGAASPITAGSVERPLRREAHGGFGERSGGTDPSNQDTAPQTDSTRGASPAVGGPVISQTPAERPIFQSSRSSAQRRPIADELTSSNASCSGERRQLQHVLIKRVGSWTVAAALLATAAEILTP